MLAPAVQGFPPTEQFPELTEAQALLAALSESDEVRGAGDSRSVTGRGPRETDMRPATNMTRSLIPRLWYDGATGLLHQKQLLY